MSRPTRSPQIRAVRYWNNQGIGISIAAVFGDYNLWRCQDCEANLNNFGEGPKPSACRHCLKTNIILVGDWAVYIGASRAGGEYQEAGDNYAMTHGEKLSFADAKHFFGHIVSEFPNIAYRD